ncbi:SWIM zinc finger family protein [Bacillus sp. FJAT-52991]|uniref:SWIM zinc finger family protein n=1 Tax=Bacillus kandeliae TaxID=3129297 RepID=A0ABZ2NBI9_9BACI
MDCNGHIVNEWKDFIQSCDEIFLVNKANKGLYKRALKDIDSGITVTAEQKGHDLVCHLSDETICSFTLGLTDFTCSCPSKKICKHVLMAIIALQQTIHSEPSEKAEMMGDFTWVLQYDLEELRKKLTEKQFHDIVFRAKFGIQVKVEEQESLTIDFGEMNEKIRFSSNPSWSWTVCSCKESEFCPHRAEAVIHYQLFKEVLNVQELEQSRAINLSNDVIQEIQNLLQEMVITGLAKLPFTISSRIERLAVLCHSNQLPRLEKQLRSLSTLLSNYLLKKATVSQRAIRQLITKIYIMTQALQYSTSQLLKEQLIGEHQTTYTEIKNLHLIGVGAKRWHTSSGYEGITAYFFNESKQCWFTYSAMQPTYYSSGESINSIQQFYKKKVNWDMSASLDDLSRHTFTLQTCKINEQYRLSSSEQTTGIILARTNVNHIHFGRCSFDNWKALRNVYEAHHSYKLVEENKEGNLFFFDVHAWGDSEFNEVTQTLRIPIYDKNEEMLMVTIKYNQDTKYLIKALERLTRNNRLHHALLGQLYKVDGEFRVEPITLYSSDGEITNITLE